VVDVNRVDAVPSLAALPSALKAGLAEGFDELSVPAGGRVANQGDFAYELFVIVEGTASVEQDGEVVATLGPGELCGEIGLLLTGRRTAAIVAETPMRLLAMFDQTFRALSRKHPELADLVHAQSRGRFTRPATV
jgi:CRP/FNR family transcriptional regulator, cyclic AMP receptor protein